MAAPNIGALTTLTGKSVGSNTNSTSGTALLTNAVAGHVLKLEAMMVANTDATTRVCSIGLNKSGGGAYNLTYGVSIAAGSVLVVPVKGIYLEENDTISVACDVANKLSAVVSYEDLS